DGIRDRNVTGVQTCALPISINRETSALSRMFHLAINRGVVTRMPVFPKRLGENPPRQGFFEHHEYLRVRAELPLAFQDVLDFARSEERRVGEECRCEWRRCV